jgi:thiamine kinase-like enzyme
MKSPVKPLDPKTILGDDIVSVLETVGLSPIAVEPITALPSRVSRRATFQITLADGRLVKVRRMKGAAEARRFTGARRAVSHDWLPSILTASGRVVVEEWVNGTSLSKLPLSQRRLEQAADLLGRLHATTSFEGQSLRRSQSTGAVRRRVERQLANVENRGAITTTERRQLLEILHAFAPKRAVFGLTHNDLCAENLVEDGEGRLHAIDNESMKLGFLEFDIARTWYRWSLSETDWKSFLRRYEKWNAAPVAQSTMFWRIAAVAKSADIRAQRTSNSDVPMRKLREIISAGARGNLESDSLSKSW